MSMSNSTQRAKKSLGQNFLQDPNIANKIVRALAMDARDKVLEIGPGPGALTSIVLQTPPRTLVLVEKDRHWAKERMRLDKNRFSEAQQNSRMREEPESAPSAFSVILADALTMPWERFSTPWKFLGNLPYNVASPLMWEIFSRASGLERAVFMVQKEVGLRITAKPGTAAYGALSVWIQSFVAPKIEFIVPPQVFRPRPKVDSAVLSFTRLAADAAGSFPPEALAKTLHFCFQRRRKQMGSIIRAAGGQADQAEAIGLDPQLRPEALDVKTFHKLALSGIFLRK